MLEKAILICYIKNERESKGGCPLNTLIDRKAASSFSAERLNYVLYQPSLSAIVAAAFLWIRLRMYGTEV